PPPAVYVRGVEDGRGDLAPVEGLPDQGQAAVAVSQMKVHHAGLSGHEPPDVRVARHPEQLVERRLAGAVVADRQLADAEDEVHQDDVAPDAPGDGGGREVIAAGVAPGADPFLY